MGAGHKYCWYNWMLDVDTSDTSTDNTSIWMLDRGHCIVDRGCRIVDVADKQRLAFAMLLTVEAMPSPICPT